MGWYTDADDEDETASQPAAANGETTTEAMNETKAVYSPSSFPVNFPLSQSFPSKTIDFLLI